MTQTAKPIAIPELQELATNIVADGKKPNLFFVSQEGVILHVGRDFTTAYKFWKSLPTNVETCLEDRKHGTVSDTSPMDDDNPKLVTEDNGFRYFGKKVPQAFY